MTFFEWWLLIVTICIAIPMLAWGVKEWIDIFRG